MSAEQSGNGELNQEQPHEEPQQEQGEASNDRPQPQQNMQAEELMTPNNSPEAFDAIAYEGIINALERKNENLVRRVLQLEEALTLQKNGCRQLELQLEELRLKEQQGALDQARLEATVQASQRTQQQYEKLVEDLNTRLQSFESRESIEDVQLKLKQATLQIECLQLELQNKQLVKEAPAQQAPLQQQIQHLHTIESLKQERTVRQQQRDLLLKQIEKFRQAVERANQQIHSELERSSHLESQIRNLSERLKQQHAARREVEATASELRQLIARKESEVGMLSSKLDSEVKRKRDNESSNHLLEKEELLKDFLELERRHVLLQQQLAFQLDKNGKLEQTLKTAKLATVSKQQYELLAKRYVSVKGCLESVMKKLAASQGKAEMQGMTFASSNETELSASKVLLQNQVKQLEVYRSMYEQTLNTPRHPEEAIELARLRRQTERQKKEVEEAEHTVAVCRSQLALKEQLLNDFAKKCFEYSNQLDQVQQNHRNLQRDVKQLRSDYEIARIKLKGSEARQIDLLEFLGDVQKECSNWKAAYEKAKQAINNNEESKRPAEHFTFERPKDPRIEVRVVEAKALKFPVEHACQTDSSEYHLNELKLVLSSGKEYVKKIASLFEPIDSIKRQLEKSKTSYLGYMDEYRSSMQELSNERNELESWKSRTKDSLEKQLRDEFVELRELLDNERLFTALKKAKYLITEYSKEEEEPANQEPAADQPVQQSEHGDAMVEEPEDETLKL